MLRTPKNYVGQQKVMGYTVTGKIGHPNINGILDSVSFGALYLQGQSTHIFLYFCS